MPASSKFPDVTMIQAELSPDKATIIYTICSRKAFTKPAVSELTRELKQALPDEAKIKLTHQSDIKRLRVDVTPAHADSTNQPEKTTVLTTLQTLLRPTRPLAAIGFVYANMVRVKEGTGLGFQLVILGPQTHETLDQLCDRLRQKFTLIKLESFMSQGAHTVLLVIDGEAGIVNTNAWRDAVISCESGLADSIQHQARDKEWRYSWLTTVSPHNNYSAITSNDSMVVKNARAIDRPTNARAILYTGHESTGGEPFY